MRKTLSTTGNHEVHGSSRHLVRVPLSVRIKPQITRWQIPFVVAIQPSDDPCFSRWISGSRMVDPAPVQSGQAADHKRLSCGRRVKQPASLRSLLRSAAALAH